MKLDIKSLFVKAVNVQEANEKRDTAKSLMLLCLAVSIACMVLGSAIGIAFLETLGMFAIVLAAILFAVWMIAKKEASRMRNATCECGERFAFPADVNFEVIGEQISSGKEANTDNIARHTNAKVSIRCICHQCGKEHTFVQNCVTKKEVLNPRGILLRTYEFPLEQELEKFFKK